MVEDQLKARGIADSRVLEAMERVPREAFVPEEMRIHAFRDGPLPIGDGQTISQPYIVALMIESARIGPEDRVLEIGAGSGYAAAICGHLAGEVHAIERIAALAKDAAERIQALGLSNVAIHCADGTKGWPDAAPYDAILVAAQSAGVPQALKDQLAIGGRLVIPVGGGGVQELVRVTRTGEDVFTEDRLCAVRFVPLIEGETQ